MFDLTTLTTPEALRDYINQNGIDSLSTLREQESNMTLLMYLSRNTYIEAIDEYLSIVPHDLIRRMASLQDNSGMTEAMHIFGAGTQNVQRTYITMRGKQLKESSLLQSCGNWTEAMVIFSFGGEEAKQEYIEVRGQQLQESARLINNEGQSEGSILLMYASEATRLNYIALRGEHLRETAGLQNNSEARALFWFVDNTESQLAYLDALGVYAGLISSLPNEAFKPFLKKYKSLGGPQLEPYSQEVLKKYYSLKQRCNVLLDNPNINDAMDNLLIGCPKDTFLLRSLLISIKLAMHGLITQSETEGHSEYVLDVFRRLPSYLTYCQDCDFPTQDKSSFELYLESLLQKFLVIEDVAQLFQRKQMIEAECIFTDFNLGDDRNIQIPLLPISGYVGSEYTGMTEDEYRILNYEAHGILALNPDGSEISVFLPAQQAVIDGQPAQERVRTKLRKVIITQVLEEYQSDFLVSLENESDFAGWTYSLVSHRIWYLLSQPVHTSYFPEFMKKLDVDDREVISRIIEQLCFCLRTEDSSEYDFEEQVSYLATCSSETLAALLQWNFTGALPDSFFCFTKFATSFEKSHRTQRFFAEPKSILESTRLKYCKRLARENWLYSKHRQLKKSLLVFLERDAAMLDRDVLFAELDKRWAYYFTEEDTQEILAFVENLNQTGLMDIVLQFSQERSSIFDNSYGAGVGLALS